MTQRSEWESFFDEHAPDYMDNVFVKATVVEVDFMLDLFGLGSGARIVDVGCGTGRHSVELARRGYRVVGIDLSGGMLAQAAKALATASDEVGRSGGSATFVKADATSFASDPAFLRSTGGVPFDAAICVCEGAFGLLGTGDDPLSHDIAILRNIAGVMGPGTPLLLTCLNATRMARHHGPEDVESGRWDPATLSETHDIGVELGGGRTLVVSERGFTAPELRLMHSMAGLEVEAIWGGTAGNWGRRP
ncbi:MAG: methyltransferase domain-containing protein, partial [Thermoplasmata archaeon]|nr:methyltransferase domain-containing protein [Thermoplasmata archaeon]